MYSLYLSFYLSFVIKNPRIVSVWHVYPWISTFLFGCKLNYYKNIFLIVYHRCIVTFPPLTLPIYSDVIKSFIFYCTYSETGKNHEQMGINPVGDMHRHNPGRRVSFGTQDHVNRLKYWESPELKDNYKARRRSRGYSSSVSGPVFRKSIKLQSPVHLS